jgi:ribosomal protein S18 acetylase RimI-like enzyme
MEKEIQIFKQISSEDQLNDSVSLEKLSSFLFEHMIPYEDKHEDILKGLKYALKMDGKPGGFIITGFIGEALNCCGVVLNTGMEGYVPENLVLFVCVHKDYRRKGLGKKLMNNIVSSSSGNIKLHVEDDNPAKYLYEKIGFKSKYLEMRYSK